MTATRAGRVAAAVALVVALVAAAVVAAVVALTVGAVWALGRGVKGCADTARAIEGAWR